VWNRRPVHAATVVQTSRKDLFGKVKAFKGFDALPYILAGIFNNEVVPDD
jgi:hypothetical protein